MPKASIIYDKFHFMQFVNTVLDEVRKSETNSNKLLKWSRYLCLKNTDDLKEKELIKLN